jgi:DNA repair exonuclease SbcCD ATPase subunit
MIRIKSVTARNFLSVGNVTQSVNLDRADLTLILGENLDLGGDDAGARNGTGKSALLNIVSYALYGSALTNIKKDNLINRTNDKNMLVTVEFEKDGQDYRIERGRKPNILKFYVGGQEQQATDESQGDSRETQAAIEKLLSMSHTMFQHIVALNTYTLPFLSLRANEQREIIEQLLGITLLSEKADTLKERIRNSKEAITQAEADIRAQIDANKRIQEQIAALERRQTLWLQKHDQDIEELRLAYDQLNQIDIDTEILAHRALTEYSQRQQKIAQITADIRRAETEISREHKTLTRLDREILALENHKCHACGQDFHDHKQAQTLAERRQDRVESERLIGSAEAELMKLQVQLTELGELGTRPTVFYDRESDAIEHRATLAGLQQQITAKQAEQDPYLEQIVDMRSTALVEITYDQINQLTQKRDHEEFLLKLLTNKDSFIRKKIIDQNLNYLNTRLSYYLEKIGLPHQVVFQNDLSVEITELGRDLDFDNLSRGERNRLILSLSWAFRDVYESLYHRMNLLFVDELVDSGLDASGMESSLAILKKISRDARKSVWLVSHRDELVSRVSNILRVTKQNGFTTYSSDVEV